MRWVSEDPYKHNPPPFPDPEAVWRLRRLIAELRPRPRPRLRLARPLARRRPARPPTCRCCSPRATTATSARSRTLVRDGRALLGAGAGQVPGLRQAQLRRAKGTAATAGVTRRRRPLLRREDARARRQPLRRRNDRALSAGPRRAAVVIPNFHEEPGARRRERCWPGCRSARSSSTSARFRRIKGIEELFAAYASLADPPPLVLAGNRDARHPGEASRPGSTVLNDVPYPTVMAMWERALFGVFPSKCAGGAGQRRPRGDEQGRAMIGTGPAATRT